MHEFLDDVGTDEIEIDNGGIIVNGGGIDNSSTIHNGHFIHNFSNINNVGNTSATLNAAGRLWDDSRYADSACLPETKLLYGEDKKMKLTNDFVEESVVVGGTGTIASHGQKERFSFQHQ